jgi:hypothetical protein
MIQVTNDPVTTVTGRVVFPVNVAATGVTVTLDHSNGRKTTTDSQGRFTFSGVGTVSQGNQVSVTMTNTTSGLEDSGRFVLAKSHDRRTSARSRPPEGTYTCPNKTQLSMHRDAF